MEVAKTYTVTKWKENDNGHPKVYILNMKEGSHRGTEEPKKTTNIKNKS